MLIFTHTDIDIHIYVINQKHTPIHGSNFYYVRQQIHWNTENHSSRYLQWVVQDVLFDQKFYSEIEKHTKIISGRSTCVT